MDLGQIASTIAELRVLPSCPVTSRSLLPSVSAVYFLMRGEECLYVGQSADLQTRLAYHERFVGLDSLEELRLLWKPVPPESLVAVERRMIEVLRPTLNMNLVPFVPPPSEPALAPDAKNFTTTEAAEALGISRARVIQLLADGKFKGAERKGRDWVIPEGALKYVKVYGKSGRPKKEKG